MCPLRRIDRYRRPATDGLALAVLAGRHGLDAPHRDQGNLFAEIELRLRRIGLGRQHAIERQPRQVIGRPEPPDQLLVGLKIAAQHQAEIANDPQAVLGLARGLGGVLGGGERLLGRAGNQARAAPAVAMGAVDPFKRLARRLEQFIE